MHLPPVGKATAQCLAYAGRGMLGVQHLVTPSCSHMGACVKASTPFLEVDSGNRALCGTHWLTLGQLRNQDVSYESVHSPHPDPVGSILGQDGQNWGSQTKQGCEF